MLLVFVKNIVRLALHFLQGNLGMMIPGAAVGFTFPVNGLLGAPLNAGDAVLALVQENRASLFYYNVAGRANTLAKATANALAAYLKSIVGGGIFASAAAVHQAE